MLSTLLARSIRPFPKNPNMCRRLTTIPSKPTVKTTTKANCEFTPEEKALYEKVIYPYVICPAMVGSVYCSLYFAQREFDDSMHPEKKYPYTGKDMKDTCTDTVVKTVCGFMAGVWIGAGCGVIWPVSLVAFLARELSIAK